MQAGVFFPANDQRNSQKIARAVKIVLSSRQCKMASCNIGVYNNNFIIVFLTNTQKPRKVGSNNNNISL